MGEALVTMDAKIAELLTELQREKAEKEDWRRKYREEKALSMEYKNERDTCKSQLGATEGRLNAVERRYEV